MRGQKQSKAGVLIQSVLRPFLTKISQSHLRLILCHRRRWQKCWRLLYRLKVAQVSFIMYSLSLNCSFCVRSWWWNEPKRANLIMVWSNHISIFNALHQSRWWQFTLKRFLCVHCFISCIQLLLLQKRLTGFVWFGFLSQFVDNLTKLDKFLGVIVLITSSWCFNTEELFSCYL